MRRVRPIHIWATAFSLWAVFLSGILATVVGSPGILQSLRLHSLLTEKQKELSVIRSDLSHLQADAELLEKSSVAQHREIRRVLGYAAPDEIVFDFTGGQPL